MKDELQKEYDQLIQKIEKEGYKVKKGKVLTVSEKLVFDMSAEYYSHFDGHMSEAITEEDGFQFDIPQEVSEEIKDMDKITFDVEICNEADKYNQGTINILYKGKILDNCLCLERETKLNASLSDLVEIVLVKKDKGWELDSETMKQLNVINDMEEHTWCSMEIFKRKVYS